MPQTAHHTPNVRLDPRRPPPAHYYADNLLALVEAVLDRYGDILTGDERDFGRCVERLTVGGQRLLARLVGRLAAREDASIREDSLDYAEVGDVQAALAELAEHALVERCPAMPPSAVLGLLTRAELRFVFWDVAGAGRGTKADHLERILAANPPCFCRWRVRRFVGWVRLARTEILELYRLLFFGDRRQDLTTFVLRDLGVYRYEPVDLSRQTRQFPDRETLNRFLDLAAAEDETKTLFTMRVTDRNLAGIEPTSIEPTSIEPTSIEPTSVEPTNVGPTVRQHALGAPHVAAARILPASIEMQPKCQHSERSRTLADLVHRLWVPLDNRMLERRRCRALNRLGRNLEREGDFDTALACYARSTLAPARERRMRILDRLGDEEGVEELRSAIFESPWTALEADFAGRFSRPFRRRPAPMVDEVLTASATGIEAYALGCLTADGGVGWHLENHLPMAVFALAYWSWLFAPVEGAFVNAFQTGPVDLFWPDFFKTREAVCQNPLDGPLKLRLRETARAKAGVANRLFNWQRFTPAVADVVVDAIPEADLRALAGIVREDLPGKRSGFPDLTVVYGPGQYEFVEVKGPGDQLQIHQRLWIEALERRGLPVRVLRYRR